MRQFLNIKGEFHQNWTNVDQIEYVSVIHYFRESDGDYIRKIHIHLKNDEWIKYDNETSDQTFLCKLYDKLNELLGGDFIFSEPKKIKEDEAYNKGKGDKP